MRPFEDIDIDRLLSYDAKTGDLIWKPRGIAKIDGRLAGKKAGRISPTGYLFVGVNYRTFLAHRVAWRLARGVWPDGEIDHVNGNRADNRLENLRVATRSENMQNVRASCRRYGRLMGASWNSADKNWKAQICVSGKRIYLGAFATEVAAHAAYRKAKSELHRFNPCLRETA